MPIRNLADRIMLPRLGKIHLGVKVQTEGGKEYPRAVDYFVCPPEVQKVYGEKPTLLDIMFPIDDQEKAASQFYRAYTRSRGLVCKGDGENAVRLVDLVLLDKTGEYSLLEAPKPNERVGLRDIVCLGEECPDYQAKRCRAICNLQFLLPKVPGIGIWQIDTSSWNGMVRINSALRLLQATAGHIHGIPLTLALEPLEVSPDGKKKTVHILNLKLPNVTLAEFQAIVRQRALPGPAETPAPDDEMPDLLFPEQAGMVKAPEEPPAAGPAAPAAKEPAPSAEAPQTVKAGAMGKPQADAPTIESIRNAGELLYYVQTVHKTRTARSTTGAIIGKDVTQLATAQECQDAAGLVDAVVAKLGKALTHATPEELVATAKQVQEPKP